MSKIKPPPLQTGNRRERRTGASDRLNLLIVNAWNKEEQKLHAREKKRLMAAREAKEVQQQP